MASSALLLAVGCSGADALQSEGPLAESEPELALIRQGTNNTPPVVPTSCEGLVQAVGATASSIEGNNSNYTASKAIDSSMTSRWSSQFSDPQWLKIDLGSVRAIKKVVLTWQNSYSTDYDLQVSNTGVDGSWTTVHTNAAGNGGTDEVDNLAASGRYLRMFSRKRKTQYGNSLHDVKVYENTCPCQGKIQPISVAASSVETGTNLVASKATDGNVSTRWSSQFSDPQWISMDFGATKQFKRVVLHWETAASAKYDLQVSANGSTWTTVYTNNSGQTGTWDIPNLTASGRYLRVYSRARTTSWGVSLWEIETFQNTCSNPCNNVVIDDNNVCTVDSCNSATGVVSHTPVAVGTACADGNLCNGNETCNAAGSCLAGTPLDTNDANPCTADSCDPVLGVLHAPTPIGTACGDANVCNGVEQCNGFGSCALGTAPVVDDGDVCTNDHCDPIFGVIHTLAPNGTPCSDDTVCNGDEACFVGACVQSTPAPEVDDANPCTADECDPVIGAVHTPAAPGSSCDDATVCNGVSTCNEFAVCTDEPAPVVDDNNPCTADSCDPLQGVSHTPVALGTSCADDDVCNGDETCDGVGSCNTGTAPVVDDGNVCTDDSCDPTFGVVHTLAPNGTPCSDETVCNGDEACFAGSCVQSTPAPELDDANPCTVDECDPITGAVHTAAEAGSDCEDGDVCNGIGMCDAFAVCIFGSAPLMDDENPCTADACDPVLGVSHTPLAAGSACGEANACSGAASCDAVGNCIAGSVLPIDDGNPCTADACDPVTGVSHTPLAAGASCADLNVCDGSETCDGAGSCVAGTPLPIDDGNPCTADVCDPTAGVVTHNAVAVGTSCADSNLCNGTETCDAAGVCSAGTPLVLTD
ncbi:MAG TPA: discoidin domain-containing protein, partial [Polyangiaceae bacterium]|nr:discoidin domain-containing protein [Polyangiaceae bacterium]